MDTDTNRGEGSLDAFDRAHGRVTVFGFKKLFSICVYRCPSVVKMFFNGIVPAEAGTEFAAFAGSNFSTFFIQKIAGQQVNPGASSKPRSR